MALYNRGMVRTEASRPEWLLDPAHAALVVIDLQEKLVPKISGAAAILENTKRLLRLAEVLNLTTFLTTQYERGLGPTVPEIKEHALVEPLDKVTFGCFSDVPFRARLAAAIPEGSTLIVCGIEAHICVLQTVLGALSEGYPVQLVADAIGSRSASNAELAIERMREKGVTITSTETVIYELLGSSNTPEFKAMLPLLKETA